MLVLAIHIIALTYPGIWVESTVAPKRLTVSRIISHAGYDKEKKPFMNIWATAVENHKASAHIVYEWKRGGREDIRFQSQPFVSPHYREQVCLGLSLWVSSLLCTAGVYMYVSEASDLSTPLMATPHVQVTIHHLSCDTSLNRTNHSTPGKTAASSTHTHAAWLKSKIYKSGVYLRTHTRNFPVFIQYVHTARKQFSPKHGYKCLWCQWE